MAQMTPLRRRMIDDMTLRNLSPATQQSYVYAVAKFSRFIGRSPDVLGGEDVRAYQLHLISLGCSWSHINKVACALRFMFGVTLERADVCQTHRLGQDAASTAHRAERRRSDTLPRGDPGSTQPYRDDPGLWRRAARG